MHDASYRHLARRVTPELCRRPIRAILARFLRCYPLFPAGIFSAAVMLEIGGEFQVHFQGDEARFAVIE